MKYIKYIIALALIIGFLATRFTPAEPNIHYADRATQQLFKSELKREGISYEIKILSGNREHVFWSPEDDMKVRKVLALLEEK